MRLTPFPAVAVLALACVDGGGNKDDTGSILPPMAVTETGTTTIQPPMIAPTGDTAASAGALSPPPAASLERSAEEG